MREIISSENAPKAIGPYSQAVKVGNVLFLSGQIAIGPVTNEIVEGGIEEQTHQVLKNLKAVTEEAGFSMIDVVQCKVFLSDLNNYGAMNKIYATYFTSNFPARAAVEVSRLPKDVLEEIMATAVKTD